MLTLFDFLEGCETVIFMVLFDFDGTLQLVLGDILAGDGFSWLADAQQ